MKNIQFNPQQISISQGTTVTWTNQETNIQHTTTSDSKTGSETWDSGILQPGQSFNHTFTHPGTYSYHCTVHPMMTASVQVTAVSTPTPTPTSLPTPTQQPIPNTPFPTNTPIPTPTSNSSETNFSLTIGLHDIGLAGDNANQSSQGNMQPQHAVRKITVIVLDTNDQQINQQTGTISFNTNSGVYSGIVAMKNLPTGRYLVKLHVDGFLTKLLPGMQAITAGQVTTFPSIFLINGDITNDNQLDILDYNMIVSCFGDKLHSPSCVNPPSPQSQGSDLNDDGVVDGTDYNIFLRELSVQKGD